MRPPQKAAATTAIVNRCRMMKLETDAIGLTTLILVLLPWIGVAVSLLFRKKREEATETKRETAATWGITMQSLSFPLVWSLPRPVWWPFPPSTAGEIVLAVAAVGLTWASALLCVSAIRTLGKQWTYRARVIAGHELVTEGPYSFVRNPIYLGMFGAIVGAGLVFSRWWTLAAAVVIFLIGNWIRIRAEEKLLRTFGSKFDEYAGRVPAFFPGVF
jgi:protein-S-isoprenylcysteine O-methyltransferase Ste14